MSVTTLERADGGRIEPRAAQRRLAALAAILLVGVVSLACSEEREGAKSDPPAPAAEALPVPPAPTPRDVAVLRVTDFGEIRFELLADVAPETAANFVRLPSP